MRDPSAPVHAACLAALTVGSVALPASSLLPTTPEGLAAILVAWTALWCGVVLPSIDGAGPGRVVVALLALGPPLAFALRAAPGALDVPWAVLGAGAALGFLGTYFGAPRRARVAALASVLLAALPLLRSADVLGPPASWTPSLVPALPVRALEVRDVTEAGRPTEAIDAVPLAWRGPVTGAVLRVGSLARTPAQAGSGPAALPLAGARWMPVPASAPATWTLAGPVLRVVGGREAAVGSDASLRAVTGPWRDTEVLDLDPFDAVVLLDGTPEDEASAAVLASFARRGGLLVGVGDGPPWPPALARALGTAGRAAEPGPAGVHALGAGRTASVRAARDVAGLLDRGLEDPRAATAFDRATEAPRTPAEFRAPRDAAGNPAGAALAAAWVAAFGLLASTLRGRVRVASLPALAAAGIAAVALVTTPDAGPRGTPFVVEVGGIGGRRVAGLHVAAGPAGWVGPRTGDLASESGLRALGFTLLRFDDGLRLALRPRGTGWIVEESVAREAGIGLDTVGSPPDWAVPLLRPGGAGDPPARLLSGHVPYDGPRPPGVRLPEGARALLVKP